MNRIKAEYQHEQSHKETVGHALAKQWDLVKSEIDVKRQKEMGPLLKEAFQLKEGEWSPLLFQGDGDLCFFQLLERKEIQESTHDEMTEARKPLVIDAQRKLMNQILDLFQEKKLISLKQNEAE
jgi:hypothetical protein